MSELHNIALELCNWKKKMLSPTYYQKHFNGAISLKAKQKIFNQFSRLAIKKIRLLKENVF